MKTRIVALATLLSLCFIYATEDSKQSQRIDDSNAVLKDIQKKEAKIPKSLMETSEGVMIFPKLLNVGLGIGGKRGKGLAMIKKADGSWSDPVFITLTGGSIGFQAGVQTIDLILVFKHRSVMKRMNKGDFTIGGDISATAGPLGRNTSAGTDYKMSTEIYSYSISRGLFAGLSIQGASLKVDSKADKAFYGKKVMPNEIFSGAVKTSSASVAAIKESLNII